MKLSRLLGDLLLIIVAASMLQVTAYAAPKDAEIPITTSSDEALMLFKQGRDLSERLRYNESKEYYKKAIDKDPNFARAYFNLAFSEDNPKGFFDNLNKAVALVDGVSEGERLLILGAEAGVNDDITKQKELYQKLVATYPKDKRAHNALANYYFGQREFALAIEEYKKTTEIDPDFTLPYNQLGYAYLFTGRYSEAEKMLKRYVELIPDEPNPHDSYAEILMKQGKFDESIEAYKKALSLKSDFFRSLVGIGMNLVFKGKGDEGRKQFQKFYDTAHTDGQRRQALFWTLVSYIDEGKFDEALEATQKRYDDAEKNKDASAMSADLVIMGDIYYEAGKLDEAKVKYTKAVEVIEESDRSEEIKKETKQGLLFNEARIALKKGALATAKSKTDEYRKQAEAGQDPLEMQICHQLAGMIALEEELYEDALKELQQANQRNPRNLCRMAQAYEGKGEKENAEEMWTQAANFNEINYVYAFIRNMARKKLEDI